MKQGIKRGAYGPEMDSKVTKAMLKRVKTIEDTLGVECSNTKSFDEITAFFVEYQEDFEKALG